MFSHLFPRGPHNGDNYYELTKNFGDNWDHNHPANCHGLRHLNPNHHFEVP